MNFPILSAIIFIPLIGAFFILITKGTQKNVEKNSQYVAIFSSLANLFLAVFLWYSFDASTSDFQFIEEKRYGRPVGIAPQNIMNHDYVISEANPHPNKKGHEWLANYIKLHGFNSQRVEEKK